jgi:hypothetical protein
MSSVVFCVIIHDNFTISSCLRQKINNPPKNVSPSNLPSPVRFPGIDPIGKTPSANPVYRTYVKDSHPKPASDRALTPSRTRLLSFRGKSDGLVPTTSPEGTQPRRVPAKWARTIRSLVQVRGLTRPSIPPSFHCRQEKCSKHFPKSHGFLVLQSPAQPRVCESCRSLSFSF